MHESQDDFAGPTAQLELGTHRTCETWFKLHPFQTRGRYGGLHTKDYGPHEPSRMATQRRPLPGPYAPCPRVCERDLSCVTQVDTSTIQKMVSSLCGNTFAITNGLQGESTIQHTIPTPIDVRNQLSTDMIVPQKGMKAYVTTEAIRFLYEVARANAILQTYDEHRLMQWLNSLPYKLVDYRCVHHLQGLKKVKDPLNATIRPYMIRSERSYYI